MVGVGNVPPFDQRGAPFPRVAGARIDIGAFELAAPSANFDGDSDVDGADFLAWQLGFGATGVAATRANGNADGDGDVDGADLGVWKAQFGVTAAVSAAAPAAGAALTAAQVDAAMAMLQLPDAPTGRPRVRARWLSQR